jgi:molybdate transport system ATP-binding protein
MLWLSDKKIICFDDPYAGLDAAGRQQTDLAIRTLLTKKVTVVVTGTDIKPPAWASQVLYIHNKHIAFNGHAEDFISENHSLVYPSMKSEIRRHESEEFQHFFEVAAEMKNISLKYADKIVFQNFSWTVKRGEKWLVTGPNGSGKSTLLSLIYGDNPLAYSFELVLFDKKRGSGETIWDIKRPIGYFSSELQQFFPLSMTLYEAVLTGYSDHLHVRSNLTREHCLRADELIERAGIKAFRDTRLLLLSDSQRRLGLVCRALVKFSPVVILDEPCQGLDQTATETINSMVDEVCSGDTKTLIYVTHQTAMLPRIINRHLDLEGRRKQ